MCVGVESATFGNCLAAGRPLRYPLYTDVRTTFTRDGIYDAHAEMLVTTSKFGARLEPGLRYPGVEQQRR